MWDAAAKQEADDELEIEDLGKEDAVASGWEGVFAAAGLKTSIK